MDDIASVENLIGKCISNEKKKILIIYDDTTENILEEFTCALKKLDKECWKEKNKSSVCHGKEPSLEIKKRMLSSEAVICLTQYSLAHTKARKEAEEKGIPFLSLPNYDRAILSNEAMQVDYFDKIGLVEKYTSSLSQGHYVEIETELGTALELDISNRLGNCCPGCTTDCYLLGSPPDIEANIAPNEEKTQGIIVIDGSVTDERIGLLKKPVTMNIVDGKICCVCSDDKYVEKLVQEILTNIGSEKAFIVGELGIGFNDKAKLCGNMLIDEGAMGCIHFGMGSNWTIGGKNKVDFHLDFVMTAATVKVDGIKIIDKGALVL
ncbi:hypothetical protein D4759_31885 [Clostridiales bacterium AHG0011]|nr:hypothetical protein [Clostridiales bacterium AHG0011]